MVEKGKGFQIFANVLLSPSQHLRSGSFYPFDYVILYG